MTDHPLNEDELELLFSQICEGEATNEQRQWLSERLADSEQMRRYWMNFMATEVDTADTVRRRATESAPLAQPIDFARIFAEGRPPRNDADRGTAPEPAAPSRLGGLGRGRRMLGRSTAAFARAIERRRHPTYFWGTVVALTFVFCISWVVFIPPWRDSRPDARPAGPSAAPFVARIVGGAASWSETSGDAFLEANLRQGQQLELLTGWAKIRFHSGAVVTLKSPARFLISGDKRITLDSGLGRIEVHNVAAQGFAVSVPNGVELVDLGTEFVVDVKERDGETSVDARVVQGRIQITTGNGAGRVLSAGDTVRVARQQVEPLAESMAPRFELPLPRPLHQWTFNDGTPRDSAGGAPGELFGGAEIAGGRLLLDGVDDYLRSTPLKTPITAKTLVVWVTLANLEQQSGAALTIEDAAGSVFDAVVFAELNSRQWIAGSDFYTRTVEAGGAAFEDRGPSEEVMLAIVYAPSGEIALYRNAVPVSRYRKGVLPTYAGPAAALLGLRHSSIAAVRGTPEGNDGYLAGSVNEARIYNATLTAEQIQALRENGPVRGGEEQVDVGQVIKEQDGAERDDEEHQLNSIVKP